MTENQWLVFVGIPAFFAIILLIVDYVRAQRRRLISATFLDEKSERALAEDPQAGKPASSRPTAVHPDPVAELERLITAKRPN